VKGEGVKGERPSADAGPFCCAPSIVQQLGGASPLHILMEEK